MTIHAERLVVTSRLRSSILDHVCNVVLGPRIEYLMRVDADVVSLGSQEIGRQLRQILLMGFGLLVLRHVLTWS